MEFALSRVRTIAWVIAILPFILKVSYKRTTQPANSTWFCLNLSKLGSASFLFFELLFERR